MKRDEILIILFNILQDMFGETMSGADENASPSTIDGWDSYEQVELLGTVEQRFNIKLTYDDVINLVTVKDIADVLEKKLNG